MFVKNKFEIEAFSEICYVGTKTTSPPTDFKAFRKFLLTKIKDQSIRAARRPSVMFHSLRVRLVGFFALQSNNGGKKKKKCSKLKSAVVEPD